MYKKLAFDPINDFASIRAKFLSWDERAVRDEHPQQMLQRSAQYVALATNRRGASAAWQVFVKEASDRPLVDPI